MSRLLGLATYDALITALLFLGIILTCGLTPMQTDTWWQLRAGHDMWVSKRVLLADTYSHTAYGTFWPNHEWMAEIIFYVLYRIGGFALLTLFAAGLIAGGWAATWRLSSGEADRRFVWVGLALVSSAGWWEPRPHAFSILFIPLMVLLLVRGRHWWIPLMFLVWANVHGGVLLGLVLLAVGLAAQTMVEPRRWRRSILLLAACAIAMTATPLGLSFWTEIPQSLQRINRYTLDEWKRPALTEAVLLPFWGIAATFCVALARGFDRVRRATPGEAALYACALVLLAGALSAVRNVGPFLMIAVPAVTHLLPVRARRPAAAAEQRPVLNLALISIATVAVAATMTWAYRTRIDRLRWAPVPAAALAALEQCPENLYNRYDEGGPLLWFAPGRKVFLDGRQDPYPAELVLAHIAMETGTGEYRTVFSRHGIHCAYLPVFSPTAKRLSADGWKALYRGPNWVVLRD